MTTVRAIECFDHNGKRMPGERIPGLSTKHAAQLVEKGLAVYVGEDEKVEASDPIEAAGVVIPSSASQAAQASPQTIVKPSISGKKRGRKPKNAQ